MRHLSTALATLLCVMSAAPGALAQDGDRLARPAAAARSGDTAAAQRLLTDAAVPDRATPGLADALAASGVSGEGGLLLLLNSRDAQTRGAAARLLGTMKVESGRAQ